MSHLPGCPKNSNLYAECTCAEIDLRENTAALNRHADALAAERADTLTSGEYEARIAALLMERETLAKDLRIITADRDGVKAINERHRSSLAYWQGEAARLRSGLEKWNLSDDTWRVLEMGTRPATDTVYGWTVQKWRDVRAALARRVSP